MVLSADVLVSGISAPQEVTRSIVFGSLAIVVIFLDKLSTSAGSIPLGPKIAIHAPMAGMSFKPDSVNVGMCGATSLRFVELTANASSLPALIWGNAVTSEIIATSTSPARTACNWREPVGYGMCVVLTPALTLIISPR